MHLSFGVISSQAVWSIRFEILLTRHLYHSAQILQKSLKDSPHGAPSGLPTSEQLTAEVADSIIPWQLHNILAWLMQPTISALLVNSNKVELPVDIMVRLRSIAQDIMYTNHHGRIVTTKHVALGVSIYHLTKNVQVLTLLNRFGHSVSHSYICELETAVAQDVIEEHKVLPQNIDSQIYTTAVWDNNDLSEKTLSGRWTTHNTNGILIQRSGDNSMTRTSSNDSSQTPRQKRSGQRSLEQQPSTFVPYFLQKRQGPGKYSIEETKLAEDKSSQVTAERHDFAWLLLRQSLNDQSECQTGSSQVIPSWSGFNAAI
ncbi:hypothetical protein BSL78_22854 [Apostichopus japonicus]|uniref:Uncharacterized protein n=1 Tax=Stichopus japonicus TaxID=307972 RepID=A0A2G8JX58_STIJA|nr:hypothetical protein BSL78_22854 [Apostichopus japonicus]